ncbi:N-methyl-L-tryptophan oxidase [Aquabacter sp. L1I39]|uniref:N-methyl-L-tryptophan oxidase n=1 Tax=Aquabacter sp. L1I39 TaxID=2820278 RepID=UPI001ADD1811|nr:N-methyl-L-tryptophan oxidase [Aquabacter sp. L1I39]QTL03558.1 N-methyl-L-tryptophan oxidase [Aquabacter sp. L1I39]
MSLPSSSCDVAVIGLGAMGSAVLYQLAKTGARVVGIDRFSPPHTFGSSHGDTRITREAVGEGADYVPLVRASHRIWRELEAETGEPLLVPAGTLVMASASAPNSHHGKPDFLRRTVEVAQAHAIPHEVLDAAEIRRRFPAFVGLRGDEQGYFEPGGGYVRPEAAIRTQIAEAVRLGAQVMTDTKVTGLAPDGAGVCIETERGAVLAGQVVVAAGPWAHSFLGPALKPAFRVQRQVLHWMEITEPALFPANSPVFIWMHGDGDEDYVYGFPPAASPGSIKVATEQYATSCDPDTVERTVSDAEVAAMHAHHIAGKLAGIAPRATRSAVCLYTTSRDNGFLIDAHPEMPRVLLVSACSGHGFKHSAGIGEAVARHLLEPGTPLGPAFGAQRLMAPRG